MTTCAHCLKYWAARTPAQLDIRRINMASAPNATPAPCPQCDGTEWATTDTLIKEMPATRGRGWFQKVLAKVLS